MKQSEVKAEIGVAAFITEEQIDHRVDDPQMRFEMYVVMAGDEKATCRAEDHGYVREGGAFLTILEVTADAVTINTKSGKRTITLAKQ
jgi:anti-sigma regulatory factor (Ser/Thr protein kinase)